MGVVHWFMGKPSPKQKLRNLAAYLDGLKLQQRYRKEKHNLNSKLSDTIKPPRLGKQQ